MDLLRHNLKKRILAINENRTEVPEEEVKEVNIKEITNYFKIELEKLKLDFDQQLNQIKKELEEVKNVRIKEDKVEDKIENIVEDNLDNKLNEELDIFSSVPTVEKELKPKSKPRAKKNTDKKEINNEKK
jgi:hypothetical protein